MPSVAGDPNSCVNFDAVITKHINLNWIIDFEAKKISGCASLSFVKLVAEVREVLLDAIALQVDGVTLATHGIELPFEYLESGGKFGGKLIIKIPAETPTEFTLNINYVTTSGCTALQWLNPEQTIGKQYPYLFSQCQAIHARSLLPCQDTPSVKATYKANVTVKAPMTVVMSANIMALVKSEGDLNHFVFEQTTPIPSYLIAIGAGNIQSKEIGPRSSIWCEPELLEKAAWEFEATEGFLKNAEAIAGPYIWGRYDILLLPASFPFGGMENPCLTFLTPSLLAGDRSLVNVVAHEIAHSWTGNLVTNSTWEHFWLNEGFTTFLERKLIATIEGGEPARHLHAIVGLGELQKALEDFGPEGEGARLLPNLSETNPDDVFSVVPYEKGHTLLFHIEQIVGGANVFDQYLREHVKKFSSAPIDTETWRNSLYEYFSTDRSVLEKLKAIDWDAWFKGTGMPPVIPEYDRSQIEAVERTAQLWFTTGQPKGDLDEFRDTFSVNQKLIFLNELDKLGKVPHSTIKAMDNRYNLTGNGNVEILLRWFQLCLHNSYTPAFEAAAQFATQHGRMKYCRPIYK